jgi:geranylgeranyl reductase family protein
MKYDVIIAGAGPCGSAAAEACAQFGLQTLCIEEHGTIGYPVQCAGLLSTAAFAECRVSDRPGTGRDLTFDARKTMAFVVDRGMLDRMMAQAATDAGAEFRLRQSVVGVHGNSVRIRGPGGVEDVQFRILIAADGPRSTIARLLHMQRAKVFLAGIQADLPGECNPDHVEIYPDAAPDFFGWSIPVAPGRIRVGLCTAEQVPWRFRAFMKRFGPGCIHLVTGTLPLGIMPKTYGNRTLFCGDAAGFAKPTSGGGIYTGDRKSVV